MQIKKNTFNILEKLARPKTATIFLSFSILAYIGLALSTNFTLLQSYLWPFNIQVLTSLIPSLVIGYPSTASSTVVLTTFTTALLIGLNLALLSNILTAEGATGSLAGSILGLSISGCAACTTGVISLAGASIGLGFLPFNGLELNLAGIVLLGYTSLYISSKDLQKICKV